RSLLGTVVLGAGLDAGGARRIRDPSRTDRGGAARAGRGGRLRPAPPTGRGGAAAARGRAERAAVCALLPRARVAGPACRPVKPRSGNFATLQVNRPQVLAGP